MLPRMKVGKDTDQTRRLWNEFQQASSPARRGQIRNELILHYQPLVRITASLMLRLTPPGQVELEDLVRVGTLGLMQAIESFDVHRGVQFQTCAIPRVRGAIRDWQRQIDWVPRSVRHGGGPIRRMLSLSDECLSGEDPCRPMRRVEEIVDPTAPLPDQQAARTIWWEQMLRDLSRVERRVLNLYYRRGLTMKQVGAATGMCESRVSQVHARLLRILRASREQLAEIPCD